jgi:transposase
MFVRAKKRGDRTYLMIVENQRVHGRVTQRVRYSLGRLDVLQDTGQLDALLLSAQRFSEKLAILGAHERGESITTRTTRIGPALVFERLWRALGLDKVLTKLLADRKFEFAVERAVFLTVLHRLFASGSDRAAETWKDGYAIRGVGGLALHHLYRAMAWLGEPLPKDQQWGATPFTPRCVKDRIEEDLFATRRDLFTGLDLVFFDTTSIYFEGQGGQDLGAYGFSKDHRPDLKQMVVGVVLDQEGTPICSEMWPGNTTDVKSLIPVVERLKEQFHVGRVCIVADRGMISEQTLAELEARGWKYILGVRMRSVKKVRDTVLSRGGRYEEVYPQSRDSKAPSPLKVKDVQLNDQRYIVCLNEDQAEKDRHDREAIVASLRDALAHGDKSLIGNKGYRRYVRAVGQRFTIDTKKVDAESRYDGKWVLTTNTDLSARDTALKYKQLWMVEDMFRSMKSLLETRPVYHKCDETIRGHVFCSFLALVLRKELQDRLEAKGWRLEWADVIRDLDNLLELEVTVGGKGYLIRNEVQGTAGKAAQAAGTALPPALRPCEPTRSTRRPRGAPG